jgi:hypothetical protein
MEEPIPQNALPQLHAQHDVQLNDQPVPEAAQVDPNLILFKCKKCRLVLFTEAEAVPHEVVLKQRLKLLC